MDAIIAALQGVTKANDYEKDLNYVSETYKGYEQIPKSKLPAAFPIDTDERKRWAALEDTSTDDLISELTVAVTTVAFDRTNNTADLRNDLMRDIEKAIANDATLLGLVHEVEPKRVTTDKGMIPNFTIFGQEFLITYFYNSANGG